MCHKQDIMEVVCTTHKGGHRVTIGKYYIHRETTRGTHIDDESTVSRNGIFDVVVHHESNRWHSSQYVTCNGLDTSTSRAVV